MKSIDLGMSYGDMMPEMPTKQEEHYPSFHYEGDEELDIPHEGIMEVRYKKTSSSVSERDGKKHYSCTIEVRSIEDTEEDDAPTRKHNEAEDALDELAAKMMKEKEKKDY